MSYLVVGISHRSADINVLERVALDADAATKLALAVKHTPAVAESAPWRQLSSARHEAYGIETSTNLPCT